VRNRTQRGLLYNALYMAATRTQIYLTSEQRERLDALGNREGKALAELVRDAVDEYLAHTLADPRGALDATFGALPDLDVPTRDEWDRA
jgi:predicted DNA-binding protein